MPPMLRLAAVLLFLSPMAMAQDEDFELPPPPKGVSGKVIGKAAENMTFKPDLSQVLKVGDEETSRDYPCIERFAKGDRQLSFVAIEHKKAGDLLPVFKLMDEEFTTLSPDVVIVEGFPSGCGECPTNCSAGSVSGLAPAEQGACSKRLVVMRQEAQKADAWHAASTAYNAKRAFIGGEVSNQELKNFIASWLSVGAVKKFHILHSLAQNKQDTKEKGGTFSCDPAQFKVVLDSAATDYAEQWGESSSLSDSERTFYMGECLTLSPDKVQPRADAKATEAQKAALYWNLGRDRHLAQVIGDMLNAHKKVLVVYGGGHYQMIHKVLEKMMLP